MSLVTLNVTETETFAITDDAADRLDLTTLGPPASGPPDPPVSMPNVQGLSAEQMADQLNDRGAALLAATADVVIRDDGTLGLPGRRDGVEPTDADLVAAEDRIRARAEDLRTHAEAVLDATEHAGITLPIETQKRAAELVPLLAAVCDRLPLPEVMNRVRAAVVGRDSASLSLYLDLLPGRLATVPTTASPREHAAAAELKTLLGKVKADLTAKYGDPETLRLRERAAELRRTANAAHGRASKRRTSERALHRLGAAAERHGLGKTLVPILNADGSERRDASGAVEMRYYDENDADYAARKALDLEREKYGRGRLGMVRVGIGETPPPAPATAPPKPKPVRGPSGRFAPKPTR